MVRAYLGLIQKAKPGDEWKASYDFGHLAARVFGDDLGKQNGDDRDKVVEAELTLNPGRFGNTVALSGDGSTAGGDGSNYCVRTRCQCLRSGSGYRRSAPRWERTLDRPGPA